MLQLGKYNLNIPRDNIEINCQCGLNMTTNMLDLLILQSMFKQYRKSSLKNSMKCLKLSFI